MDLQPVDIALLAILAFGPIAAAQVIGSVAGESKVLRYRAMIVALIVLGSAALLGWMSAGRSLSEVGLVVDTEAGFIVATGAAFVFLVYAGVSVYRSRPERQSERQKRRMAFVAGLLPGTKTELAWFTILGLVAGLSEELAYRGYLLLGLSPGGPWIALVVVTLLFGVAHLYQGVSGALGTAAFGLVLGLLTLLAGSIVPAVIVHAGQDVSAGLIGYTIQGAPRST